MRFKECGGNHVFRYNEVYSSWGHYFADGYGGGDNSFKGMPNSDSDVYGNIIKHVWDDAVEAEGANNNVRVWGNYFDHTATGAATTATSKGPVYAWRNVQNRSRNKSMNTLDGDSRLYTFKSGSVDGFAGRRYVFHNTSLQARRRLARCTRSVRARPSPVQARRSFLQHRLAQQRLPYLEDLVERGLQRRRGERPRLRHDQRRVPDPAGAEPNAIIGTPIYEAGHGWENEAGGYYQLAPHSPGYDRGVRIPNFNDGFTGAAPDLGAHEAGTTRMRLGLQ